MVFLEGLKIVSFLIITGFFGLFFPKKQDIIVLASSKGKFFNGNSKALFNYLNNNTNFKAFFFIRDKNKFSTLRDQEINIRYHYSVSGLMTFLQAKTVCFTHGHADFLGFVPSPWQNWIHLDHGGGTKTNGYLQEKVPFDLIIWREISKHSYLIAKSDNDKYYKSARGYKNPQKIFVTGFPRMDSLFDAKKSLRKKVVLFAPTYIEKRVPCEFKFFFGDDTEKLKEFLINNSITLFIRFHPNNFHESRKLISTIFDETIVDICPDKLEDIQEFLPEVDILITDYSTISRDFLFLDRPMIFLTRNLQLTKDFCLPYREEFVFCGHKVNTPEQLFSSIQDILNGEDPYKEIRNFVKLLSYNNIDNKSCERVTRLIINLCNKDAK